MPKVLRELMRQESIETTMKYYVGRNAQGTAAVLWEAVSLGRLNERETCASGQVRHSPHE